MILSGARSSLFQWRCSSPFNTETYILLKHVFDGILSFMATLFLVIIYLAFISLGLPDSLLGAAWPVMQVEFGAPFEAAGLISMVITGGTIVSSLASGAVLKRLGTGKVTFVSCLMTAGSLLGFSFSPSLIWLLFLAVPLGLGAGSVDSALNNYVATHYKAHHMSWLHCFWGVGATLGPMIMSRSMAGQSTWRNGYLSVSLIQFALVILLFATLPLWDKNTVLSQGTVKKTGLLNVKGVKLALTTFLFYCAVEASLGLWGGSYLVYVKGLSAVVAAQWVSMYYAGITIGRLITGFITLKVSNRILIRAGQITALAGTALLLLPLPTICSLAGFILIGLGCAPIFPCMLHETPVRFGKENSQVIMGFQMAVAYTGSTFLPPLLGLVAAYTTIGILPFFVLVYIMAMLAGSEKINALINRND